MSYIDHLESGSIQIGDAPVPPVSSLDIWPSLDPTKPFSAQNWGISNFIGSHNQIGVHNGIGAHILTGLSSLIGFKTAVGGQVNAEPQNTSAAPEFNLSSPDGKLFEHWTYNGTPLDFLHNHSDVRLKKNIVPLSNSLNKILNLQGVSFDWNKDISSYVGRSNESDIGLVAQEVEKIIPELVSETTIPNIEYKIKNVDYSKLVPVLVEAIKEQQDQIESLRGTVLELSTKLEKCCNPCYDGLVGNANHQ
jgi:hypothetical protein